MALYNPSLPATAPRPAIFGGSKPTNDSAAPNGTFAPGTKIQVGNHKVVVQKYFSEGGFAHVYLVKLPKPIDGTDIAVLKRVAVPDKEHLAHMRTEVETMKKLKGHRPIVTYFDSHASQLKGGGYEVFLLMEFCNGGGLIDFMNTRLQNRLTEPEILKIFSDVAEGVACMHYLKPPLLHRDLKVENVLITTHAGKRRFKLCDFGSSAPPRPAATTPAECRLIEDDVQRNTTLQYRSPEMVDVYRKQPIDEKSDIWALGVLLYKLCYYTTPFEAQGQLAILNASFKYPSYPIFSDPLKKLIASMLKENPKSRPNIYQTLREACLMQGLEVPFKDIYTGRTQSEVRRNQQLPSPESNTSSLPVVGVVFAPPTQQQQVIPEVTPMRRGRPTATSQRHVSKPSPSPGSGASTDPFAALDEEPQQVHTDELSSRFPSLNQFSLLHDGGKFDFDRDENVRRSQTKDSAGVERVTEKLADEVFALSSRPAIRSTTPSSTVSRARKIISSIPDLQAVTSPSPVVHEPNPTRPTTSNYVSQGTMTNSTPPSTNQPKFTASPRLMPQQDHIRSTSLPRKQALLHPGENQQLRAPNSSGVTTSTTAAVTSASFPSLDGRTQSGVAITRAKSTNSRPRPSSTYLESNVEYLREREKVKETGRKSLDSRPSFSTGDLMADLAAEPVAEDDTNIESNVDFLRNMEDQEAAKKERRPTGSSKVKRTSLPSLSSTKTLLAGKFGDAFKRFEGNASAPPGPRTPSPLNDIERRDLTPIAGSEATDGRSDDGNVLAEDMENMRPEQRREIERRRLSMEEKRVANAAAEYRRKLADRDAGVTAPKSIGGVSRATTIQNKVRNLLDESQQGSPPKKTAEGYGRYTASSAPQPDQFVPTQPTSTTNPYNNFTIATKSITNNDPSSRSANASLSTGNESTYINTWPQVQQSAPILPPAIASKTGGPRPNAPPKPTHLNSSTTGASPPKPAYIASRPVQPRPAMTTQEKEEYIADFSKRFPSLSGIEMVEREISSTKTVPPLSAAASAQELSVVRTDESGLRSMDV